jgi:signal transduction histidine kinase
VIEIQNRGAIPAELLPVLFDPFRGAQRKRNGAQGLGLGLFIIKEIVRSHGGEISVRSSEEEGTSFSLWLPRTGAWKAPAE